MMSESVLALADDRADRVGTLDPVAVSESRVLLLVEPSLSQRYLMRALFESRGYRVISARTVAEANSKVRAGRPRLALVSWALADASACSMIQGWRRDPALEGCSVFMMDAQRDPRRAFRARRAGAVDLVPRPISAAAVEAFFELSGRGWTTPGRVAGGAGSARPAGFIVPRRLDRRILMQRMRSELDDAKVSGKPLSLGLVSLENLTDIKIEHSRTFAEEIMADVEFQLCSNVRACDLVARHTGSEFALLLPYTDHLGATTALGRVRECVESLRARSGAIECQLGITTGVVTEKKGVSSPIELIRASVAALGVDRASFGPQNR